MDTERKNSQPKASLHERIVDCAMAAFTRQGIKPVKMDDIANSLSISKRTLYETFKDKETLLFECVRRRQQEVHNHMLAVSERSANILEVMLYFYQMHLEELRQVNHRFLEDMEKYPAVLEYLRRERESERQSTISFFEKGVEQGVFRSDVNIPLSIQLMDLLHEQVMLRGLGKLWPVDKLYESTTLLFLRGIATAKGLQILEETITKQDINHKQTIEQV